MRTLIILLILITAGLAGASETPSAQPSNIDKEAVSVEDKESHETLDSFFTLYQPYLTNISAYEPIYFLVGAKPEKSKFQISFKYRLLNADSSFAKNHPWVSGIHFGYTQTSFWDLESDSMPFEDTSYKPELFHVSRNFTSRPKRIQGLFLKTGIKHESNGKSEDDSRSINTVSIQPILIFYKRSSRYGLSIAPVFRGYFNTGDHSQDIKDYRGYVDLDLRLGKADGVVFTSRLGWAHEGGSAHLDLTYPVGQTIFNNISLYMHLGYTNALAESLLQYQERTEALRFGFSFVR